jgi:hypothetical protein
MNKDLMEALARLAGLDKALAEHREDVEAAFSQAGLHRGVMRAPEDPAAEPWPPMRAGDAL